MNYSRTQIKEAINTALKELDIGSVKGMSCAAGSTHVMNTCKIGSEKYFLKFSDESLFAGVDPSLQILVEYLAYRIYSLYPGVSIPKVKLVFDKSRQRIGLASSEVKGKPGLSSSISRKKLASMLTAGVFVDVFLANWDVIGTGGSGNVIVNKDKATRIDPGGALSFRAQGTRKGKEFGKKPGELKTMLKPGTGAGNVYKHADLKSAGRIFKSVTWQSIYKMMVQTNNNEIVPEMKSSGMMDLLGEWKKEVLNIASILKDRHKEVSNHIGFVNDNK